MDAVDDDYGWMDGWIVYIDGLPFHTMIPPRPQKHAQICETLGTELDAVRVRYWLSVVQARIHRRLVADLRSPSAATSASAAV